MEQVIANYTINVWQTMCGLIKQSSQLLRLVWRCSQKMIISRCIMHAILMIICLVTACHTTVWASSTTKPILSSDEISKVLPTQYAKCYDITFGKLKGEDFAIVCASPIPGPSRVLTPPYAKIFLLQIKNGNPRLAWQSECNQDNICHDVKIYEDGSAASIISVVTSPYSGSSTHFTQRIFSYSDSTHQPVLLLIINYIDGKSVYLPGREGRKAAFMIYEPFYEMDSDKYPLFYHKYRFRLLTREGNTYHLWHTVITKEPYDNPVKAYREVLPALKRVVNDKYELPNEDCNAFQLESSILG